MSMLAMARGIESGIEYKALNTAKQMYSLFVLKAKDKISTAAHQGKKEATIEIDGQPKRQIGRHMEKLSRADIETFAGMKIGSHSDSDIHIQITWE